MTQILSRYDVRREIGRGGMGVVYEAHDLRLDRRVAMKVLLREQDSADRRRRFQQEARAASALNHPNIITVYDIETTGDVDYIVMEYVDGRPLSSVIGGGPLDVDRATRYAAEIANALAAAHAAGIVHRDLKPANVMVTADGRIKVLDFGLSKVFRPAGDPPQSTVTSPPGTQPGIIAGTGGYMSPEQATGGLVDARSDVFSFGIVMYEMLTGRRAFAGDSYWSSLHAILNEPVVPVEQARPDTPAPLARIVARCLEKDPAKRYPSAAELSAELEAMVAARRLTAREWVRRHPWAAASATLATLAVLVGGGVALARWQAERSLQAGLQEIEQHIDQARYGSAYSLARQLQRRAPSDPRVERAWLALTIQRSVQTDPSGADIFYADFDDAEPRWERFGTSPVEKTRVPFGAIRWRIEKAGFDPVEARLLWWEGRPLRLHRAGTSPPGMVYVPPGRVGAGTRLAEQAVPEFWLDKYEVTNRQFKEFVDAGGYRNERLWKHEFVKEGRRLTFTEAMDLFRDKTGRNGPASWELGTFPNGREDYAVSGISWYEAAAFAEFNGKSLPGIAHWIRATGMSNLRDDAAAGNFASAGPQPVRQLRDLGAHGTYGMSGNVKEWCFNSVEGQRYLLGGAWNEPVYMATNLDARPPFDRSETNGFRTARFTTPQDAAMFGEVQALPRHVKFPPPVSDEVFNAYRGFYAYERTPLGARVERLEEAEHWRKETITMDAAYGRERLIVHLLLPKDAAPPYQAVIYYPGSYAYTMPSSEELPVPIYFDFIPRSGRALVHPVYQGMYERHSPAGNPRGLERRDMLIDTAKDLRRTIDYLETRSDIDGARLGFYVFSTGMQTLPAIAMEPRLKTAVFLSAGFGAARSRSAPAPEIDPVNFAPRLKLPILLLGGRYDFVQPLETAQKPFFAQLGTPPADKKHFIFDAGHVPPRIVMIRETLDWLDRYLGPVRTGSSAARP